MSIPSRKHAALAKANGFNQNVANPSGRPEEHFDIFFVNTTKQEKIDQLNAVAEHRHLPVLFMRVTDLGEPSHSPEEITGSFKNNQNTKLMSCARHLSQFSYAQVKEKLESLRFSSADLESGKIRLFGCAEDSGFSFDRGGPRRTQDTIKFVDMFFNTGPDGPYKTDADKEMVRSLERFVGWDKIADGVEQRKPFPGVETVRVLGSAGGVGNFFRLTNLTMEKLGIQVDPKGKSKHNCLSLVDNSVLGAFQWQPKLETEFAAFLNANKGRNIREGAGVSKSIYDGSGFGKSGMTRREITTYGASIPVHLAAQHKYTSRADLKEVFQPAARGDAMGELMSELKINPLRSTQSWLKYVERRGFNLGMNSGKGPEYSVSILPGDGGYPHNLHRTQLRKAAAAAGLKVSYPGEDAEGANPRNLPRQWSDINLFQQMIDNNQALIFLPSGARETLDKSRELEQFMAASYYCIGKQLDPTAKGKIAIFLEHKDGDFDRFIKQVNTLFNHGAFADRPSKLIHKARSIEEAVRLADDHRMHYRPVVASPEPDSPVPDLKDRTGKYNVCVFLSASMEGVYEDKAIALGKRIQATGMTLVYGAADRNMMGGLLKGASSAAKRRKEPLSVMGSTTKIIGSTENEHGIRPGQIPDDMFYLAPNISKRKEFLFKNSHAFVLLEGGVGSLDELLTYMYYKDNHPELVKDKPMVISESAYTKDSMFKQALDLYLGQDSDKLTPMDRKSIYKRTGIMIMEAPEKLPEGSKKKLYEIEMDKAIEFLKNDRAKNHPELMPDAKTWVDREAERFATSQQTGR